MTVNRHLAALTQVLAADDEALMVRECYRTDRKWQGVLLLTVTTRRLVLTRARLFGRTDVRLNVARSELVDVRWDRHAVMPGIELTFSHEGHRYGLYFQSHQLQVTVDVDNELTNALG